MRSARDHIKLPDGGAEIMALWSVFAHCHDAFEISPPVGHYKPDAGMRKDYGADIPRCRCAKPLPASNVTSAVVFRAVEKWQPTLIIDEADTFLAENEELRGILNSGHNRRNAFILRTVGDDHEPKQFSTWAPKAIAKIGKMPPTLYSRSIHSNSNARLADEIVEPLRADRLEHLKPLVRMAARWAADNLEALKASDPEMPEALHGRAADNWRPLIAIADRAGGEWPERLRMIATKAIAKSSDETRAMVLLADIKTIFESRGVDQLHSEELVEALIAMEGRPWAEWNRGKADQQASVGAAISSRFEVKPVEVWSNGKNQSGYTLKALEPLFTRYQTPRPPRRLPDKALREIRSPRPKKPLKLQTPRPGRPKDSGKAATPYRTTGLRVWTPKPQKRGKR